jgi:hypothetical protein
MMGNNQVIPEQINLEINPIIDAIKQSPNKYTSDLKQC